MKHPKQRPTNLFAPETSKGKRVGESFTRPLLSGETKRTPGTLFAEALISIHVPSLGGKMPKPPARRRA